MYLSSVQVDESDWEGAMRYFSDQLEKASSPNELEACVLDDKNWDLHVDGRIALLRKAKYLGANSLDFLMDYNGYLASHLDPGEEQEEASRMLEFLLKEKGEVKKR